VLTKEKQMPDNISEWIVALVTTYGVKIVLALAIYLIGKRLVALATDLMAKAMTSRNVDPTVGNFVKNITYYLLLALVVVAALGQLGVETASAIAILGAAGLAVGFALQGTLSNFASGVMLILLRPLKIGDFVEVAGEAGIVKELAIFATTLTTPDNKTITISNSSIFSSNITNYSTQPTRRVDLIVGVSYNADIQQVKTELLAIAADNERILKDQDVTVGVVELADSSVNFVFRPWVKSADYWGVYFDLNERIKMRFDELGIEIPYPQMDIHTKTT
jgi:small conductance mechanosensitive channel|tara:strand:- start:1507 stop:2337 length:831 start_codon:yes stop_codon:yes gene_type:complete